MERKRTVLHGLDELEEWLDAPIQAILEEIRDVQKLDKNSYMLNGETKNSEKIVIELFFEDESRIVVQEKNAVINLSKKDALEIWNRLGPAPWVR